MAIYHKDCPQCAAAVATYVRRCACGFSFRDFEQADAQDLDAIAEEEQLYQEYLAARARQASLAASESRSTPANVSTA
ncbi:MAG: hypothetical protein A2150_05695 [Candidatus Muproteobacteria bacterium RBG_16_64_11]|uniref:UPF0547 domain-containing protein n=1 Tax=Candidatus Muproteobacteria bacterium RBG_16_64_11 TaxID=1817758 RepID=A0A1F6TDK6_9PROT|nr:MAG: hypothetical protein A2150_05695 [Candidatus Muproteobacteria bacterium RBG_16_64_11]